LSKQHKEKDVHAFWKKPEPDDEVFKALSENIFFTKALY
jgi:hypothetical protein